MKFYSEVLDKMFDSQSELLRAEREEKTKKEAEANDLIVKDLKDKIERLTQEFTDAVNKADKIMKDRDAAILELRKRTGTPAELDDEQTFDELIGWIFS